MATTSSLVRDASSSVAVNKNKNTSIHHINRSIERALDEATLTGELNLNGRTLREFPLNKCDLSDTVIAGESHFYLTSVNEKKNRIYLLSFSFS